MTEERVSFLYKIASTIPNASLKNAKTLLISHYLMRCHEITKSFGLPAKQFSSNLRCSYCCTKWKKGNYETKITPITRSKKQRRRMKSQRDISKDNKQTKKERSLLHSNQLERTCLLCKHSTIIVMKKSFEIKIPPSTVLNTKRTSIKTNQEKSQDSVKAKTIKFVKKGTKPSEINVYSNTEDVFSLQNKNNNIACAMKEPPKVIKNNKKRKDKFAGLSKAAVLASAKLAKESKNPLNLFLKPVL